MVYSIITLALLVVAVVPHLFRKSWGVATLAIIPMVAVSSFVFSFPIPSALLFTSIVMVAVFNLCAVVAIFVLGADKDFATAGKIVPDFVVLTNALVFLMSV